MNKRDIERLKHTGKDFERALGDGLYIRVRKTAKVWVARVMLNGKTRIKTLGRFPAMPIGKARLAALEVKAGISDDTGTLGGYIDRYYKDSIKGSHNRKKQAHKRPEQALRYLNQIKDAMGKQLLDNVTKADLSRFIKDYSKGRPRAGEVMRVHLVSIFADAFENGVINVNPMAGITSKSSGYKQVDRERVLTDDEIRSLWSWQNNETGWQRTEDNVRVIKFLLLTGLRISEAQTGYVDGDKFRIDDSKNGKAHWVHLTALAKAQLPLPECTSTNIQAWLKRKLISEGLAEKTDRWTAHDCRRTYATRASDAGVALHVVEKVLNHSLQGVMAIYNKAEYEAERIECAEVVEQVVREIIE